MSQKSETMKNEDLKAHYEQGHVYTSREIEEDAIFSEIDWQGRPVLEIGCGEGTLGDRISLETHYTGCDYVQPKTPRYWFYHCDYTEIKGTFDVVVMQGVLEHMDNPSKTLQYIAENFRPKHIITSSPCWFNPRGIVLQTLYHLFDAKITLADLHFIGPNDMFLDGYKLSWKDVDHDWASGAKMIDDLENRLPKVLDDVEANVEKLLHWLKQVPPQGLGATIIYHLEKT